MELTRIYHVYARTPDAAAPFFSTQVLDDNQASALEQAKAQMKAYDQNTQFLVSPYTSK